MSRKSELMEKEPRENDACLEDGNKPKVMPLPSRLEYLEDRGFSRKSLIAISVLLLLSVLLLIVVIVLAALPCTPSGSGRPLCDSPDCYRTSALVSERLNTSAEPCTDFYNFACGGWIHNHPVPPHYGDVGVVTNAQREFLKASREAVEVLPYTEDFNSLQWKIRSFYRSCMDMESVNSVGDSALHRIISLLNGWKPIKTFVINNWDSNKVLRDLHVEHGVFPFFTITAKPDDDNPLKSVIQISPSGLGLPHWSYYYRISDDKIVKAYMQLMKDLAVQLGATSQNARIFADEVFNFEKRIAEIHKDSTDQTETDKSKFELHNDSRKVTVKELREICPRVIWIDHLKAFLPSVYISEHTPVYVTSARYLTHVSMILSSTDQGTLNSYFIWTLILKYAPYLSKDYRVAFDTYSRAFTGAIEQKPLWEYCIEATDSIFHVALMSLYVQRNIGQDKFDTANEVYRGVQEAFIHTLRNVDWMDSAVRNVAIDKMRNVNSKTLYKDFFKNAASLNEYYSQLIVLKTDFLQSIQRATLFRKEKIESAMRNDSKSYLKAEYSEINPYYSDLNQITLPPVLLDEHHFSVSCPRYLSFGALGSYFGHGLIQGFEEVGEEFGRIGYTPILWNNETMVTFDEHLKCLAKHQEEYHLDVIQVPVFKNKSLINSFADIGGIMQAFYALESWDAAGNEPVLPGIDYTPDQLFFIAYAQSMCSAAREEDNDNYLQLSSYPPASIRVTGALSQVPQFAEAFKCKEHTVLNPSKRCRLW